jgi:hypothetical protein
MKAWANRPRLKVNSPVMANNIFFLSGWTVMNPYLSTAFTGQKKLQYNSVYKLLLMKHRDMQEQTNQHAENKQICMQKKIHEGRCTATSRQTDVHTYKETCRLAHKQTGKHKRRQTCLEASYCSMCRGSHRGRLTEMRARQAKR